VTRFAILSPMLREDKVKLRVGGLDLAVPTLTGPMPAGGTHGPVIGQRDGKWTYLGDRGGAFGALSLSGKQPNVQGPIDDAFTRRFLCVRGTGKAWNPAVQAWADANLKRFTYEWNRYFRGELPVKDDTDVNENDVRWNNLILFGDP